MLMRTSTTTNETTFHPLLSSSPSSSSSHSRQTTRPALVHSHTTGPFLPPTPQTGLNITIFSSGDATCALVGLDLSLDVRATIGRAAVRFWTVVAPWGAGIVAVVGWGALKDYEHGAPIPPVTYALRNFIRHHLIRLILILTGFATFIPLEPVFLLGSQTASFAVPIVIIVATGAICISWLILLCLTSLISFIHTRIHNRNRADQEKPDVLAFVKTDGPLRASTSHTLMAVLFVSALVILFVPWQVAFVGCWIVLLYAVGTDEGSRASRGFTASMPSSPSGDETTNIYDLADAHVASSTSVNDVPTTTTSEGRSTWSKHSSNSARPYFSFAYTSNPKPHHPHSRFHFRHHSGRSSQTSPPLQPLISKQSRQDATSLSQYSLLMFTWLLPLVGPALAAHARTGFFAGEGWKIGRGDLDPTGVVPVVVVVEWAMRSVRGVPFTRTNILPLRPSFYLFVTSVVTFVRGAYRAHDVYAVYMMALYMGWFLSIGFGFKGGWRKWKVWIGGEEPGYMSEDDDGEEVKEVDGDGEFEVTEGEVMREVEIDGDEMIRSA